MAAKRSAEEIERLLERYRTSGLTQAEFCRRSGIALSTFDRHLHKRYKRQSLVRVKLNGPQPSDRGFILVLNNGRRIECGWTFDESQLVQLIRVAEAV